jgi:hypothetical protein
MQERSAGVREPVNHAHLSNVILPVVFPDAKNRNPGLKVRGE